MTATQVLSLIAVVISGGFLTYQALRFGIFDRKELKSIQLKNKKTGKQATISANPTKADVNRLLDLIEH